METKTTPSAAARPVSAIALVGIYLASFVVLVILLNVVVMFVPFDNSAMGFVIVIAASGAAAHYWVWREKAVPSSGRAWRVAGLCGTLSALLAVALVVLGGYSVEQIAREIRSTGVIVTIGLFALLVALQVLMARFGMWLTFRQVAKQLAA